MDIMAIVGLLGCIGVVVWGIVDGGELIYFVDRAAIAITLGGTLTALMITFPLKVFISMPQMLSRAFAAKKLNPYSCVSEIVKISHDVRRNGLFLSLEEKIPKYKDEFLKKGLQCVVDSSNSKILRDTLETELTFMVERHKLGVSFFEKGAGLASGFGMTGALVSLINLLASAEGSLVHLGPRMGIALLTVFYGSILSNVIFLPIANKLQQRSDEEVLCRRILIEGFISIMNEENPRQAEEKLMSYVPPSMRKRRKLNGGTGIEEKIHIK